MDHEVWLGNILRISWIFFGKCSKPLLVDDEFGDLFVDFIVVDWGFMLIITTNYNHSLMDYLL